jgi:CheY-like chemotaxis protein
MEELLPLKAMEEIKEVNLLFGFPASSEKPAPKTNEKAAARRANQNLRILIIEDNKDILGIFKSMIESWGHTTATSRRGREGEALYKKFLPAAAMVDIGLPDMSGYEVAQRLRRASEKLDKKLTLIAVTGYGQEKDKLASKKSGFDFHLTKPVHMNEIKNLLESI